MPDVPVVKDEHLTARTNYCKMVGHDLSVQTFENEAVLRCSNRCEVDGKYALVLRDQGDR